ncbi:hypothetical protein Tco_1496552 [Tanacetum coccineum]
MIEGTLVLLDDDGKPLKPSKSTLPSSSNVVSKKVDDLVNEDNDSEAEDVYDEIATYMASMGFNVNKASKVKLWIIVLGVFELRLNPRTKRGSLFDFLAFLVDSCWFLDVFECEKIDDRDRKLKGEF